MSARRIITMILVNVVVSAVVVLGILYWWETNRAAQIDAATESVPIVLATPLPEVVEGDTAVATETPTPEPEGDQPLVHIVAAGDTLTNISQQYEVELDDIVAANNLLNPNSLEIGQALVIPVGGLEAAVATAVPTLDVAERPSPAATEPPATGGVNIQIAEVIGVGNLSAEAVQIVNTGPGQLAMVGWQLNASSGISYTFGQITLFGEGAGILLHTETGLDGATDLYWGLENPVWASGETVTLTDADGAVQATFQIP